MKKISLIFINLLSIVSLLMSQTPCEVNSVIYDYYEQDIKHLAIIEMENAGAPELAFAEISESWQAPIWEGLSAIFNSSSSGRDDVIDIYCIHHFGNLGNSLRIFNTMYVNADTSVSWYDNWEDGDLNTYNDEFNSFLERWGFEYDGKLASSFKIKTEQLINMFPLADTIDMLDSINFAERKPHVGAGNSIIYEQGENDRYYTFSIGWGDCPSGCLFNHSWNFRVTADCEVIFTGESGNDDIPEWLKRNCDISSTTVTNILSESEVSVFPNPMDNSLNIEIIDSRSDLLNYEIYDALGNRLLKGKFINNISINTNELLNGIYFLNIKDGRNILTVKKMIKI